MSTQNERSILGDGVDCENKPAAWYDNISINYYYEDAENGTDESDSLNTVLINFLVPDHFVATLDITEFKVDDWGHLTIYPKGETSNKLLHLGMDKGVDGTPGERGGHTEWEKTGSVQLLPGEYVIEVEQKNATYNDKGDPRYNVSKCKLALTATKRSACTISWPTGATSLGTPIDWYERRTAGNSSVGFTTYKWNWGTIDSISAELFKSLAIAVYCESTPASRILFEGNTSTSSNALSVESAFAEMAAIASVMMNRMGNSPSGNYRFNSVVTDVSEQFGTEQFPFPSDEPYKKEVSNDQYLEDEWDSYICQKLRLSIDAVSSVISGGVTVPYDRYVAKDSAQLAPSSYELIGNTMFRKEKEYYDCRTKPSNWDSLEVHPDSPKNAG